MSVDKNCELAYCGRVAAPQCKSSIPSKCNKQDQQIPHLPSLLPFSNEVVSWKWFVATLP
jgi:hypothetical protein